MDGEERVIRASEIAQFVYCARAWWLGSVEGRPSAHRREMRAGTAAHRRHGVGVRLTLWAARLGYALVLLGVLLGVVWWLGR